MKSIITCLLIFFAGLLIGQQPKKDSINRENERMEREIEEKGYTTIIDTSREIPEKRVIIKGDRKDERIMFRVEEDFVHPADSRVHNVQTQKWIMGMDIGMQNGQLVVKEVKEGLAASKAGIAAGEVILRLEDQPVRTKEEFIHIWRDYERGENLKLRIKKGWFWKTVWIKFE